MAMPPKVAGLPPNPFGAGRGNLLAAIRGGAQLKKVGGGGSDDSPVAAGGSSSRGGPHSTAATTKPTVAGASPALPPAPVAQATSINEAINNAMAVRRIHVEYEERSVASDSDSDWE